MNCLPSAFPRLPLQIAGIGIFLMAACSYAETSSQPVSLTAPPGTRMLVAPEVSDDGRFLAFTTYNEDWQGHVHMTSLSELKVEPLRGAESFWSSGGFSPDGQFVLVSQTQPPKTLVRMSRQSGAQFPIAESGNVGADWGPDNNIVMGSEKGGLRLVAAEGGTVETLTQVEEGEVGHWLPHFIEGSDAVVFYVFTGDRATGQVGLYDFRSGERKTLLHGTKAQVSNSGHLLFWRDESLWVVHFDPVQLRTRGDPVVVIPNLGADPNGDAWYSLSKEGTLVYILENSWRAIGGVTPELVIVDNWIETVGQLLPSP